MEDILRKAFELTARYRLVGRAHYLSADHYARLNAFFGIPVIAITAVVGTTIFGTIEQNPNPWLKIIAGLVSLAGTVLAALQTSLGYAQTAEKHKSAGETYRSVQRKFEMFELKFKNAAPERCNEAMTQLEGLVEKLEDVAKNFPTVSDSFYNRAKQEEEAKKNKQV